ncbi:MAG: 2OG-Fe(II) oxygenase [Thalassobaculum sp.]|uniref:2OG-Fe(II) oxygenase n=1 Tax=Thalassobaculum sp. TaxID=2022740 RepID=UPI0032ECF0C7
MAGPQTNDLVWHSFYAVVNAIPRVWPFRHLVLDRFLHPALFEALMAEDFTGTLARRHDPARITQPAEGHRFSFTIAPRTDLATVPTESLRTLWATLTDSRLVDLLTNKFADDIAKRHGAERVPLTFGLEAIEDRTGYALLPHVDAYRKMVTVLIYLPEPGADEMLGTSIYTLNRTKGGSATFGDTDRLPREEFGVAATVPYRPNTALIFPPGMNTFHGVEPVAAGTSRRLVQFQINRDTAA